MVSGAGENASPWCSGLARCCWKARAILTFNPSSSACERRMKGRISKTLETILLDPSARRQLREHLIHGRDGWVRMNGKTYRVQIDVMSKVKGPFDRRLAE